MKFYKVELSEVDPADAIDKYMHGVRNFEQKQYTSETVR